MGFSFFPKEDKFNKLLLELAAEVKQAAESFRDFIAQADPAAMQLAGGRIQEARAKSKITSTLITEELCRSFITPFDREDIHDISSLLYKVPKIIEKVQDRITMHTMQQHAEDFSRQAKLIVQAADITHKLIEALVTGKGNKPVIEGANALRDIEHLGDEVRNELMVTLFKGTSDVRDIILRRDVYDMLEKVVDRFRDVAGVAMQIVLKNS